MDIVISGTSDKPIYQQLFEQISSQIIKGQLERTGFIVTMVGKGCFVARLTAVDLSGKRTEMALDKLKKDIEYYKTLGLDMEELIELIRLYYD